MCKEETSAAADTVPTILAGNTATAVLAKLDGLWRVIGELIYYTGARPHEVIRLRYRDVDLLSGLLRITDDQGETDRVLRFPGNLRDSLQVLQTAVEALYRWDRERGFGNVSVPLGAYLKTGDAHCQLNWQFYFPHFERFPNGTDGDEYRHHVELYRFEEELTRVAELLGVRERVTGYTLRHTRAVALLCHGHSPEKVQAILGQTHPEHLLRYASLVSDRSAAA